MDAKFTFADGFWILDSMWDFRWFQVITSDSWPVTWNNGQNPQGYPFVNPPSGGWGYQKPTGDDKDPFYWNTVSEWPLEHDEGYFSQVEDGPGSVRP